MVRNRKNQPMPDAPVNAPLRDPLAGYDTELFGIRRSNKNAGMRSMFGGIGLCVACAAISLIGTHSVVDAMNRSAQNQMAVSSTQLHVQPAEVEETVEPEKIADYEPEADEKGTDQLAWAKAYGITWDENGNPVNKDGSVADDPSTKVNEVARAIGNGTATKDGMSVAWAEANGVDTGESGKEDAKVPAVTNPYDGQEGVSQSDGKYIYTIREHDTLSGIAKKLGVSLDDIAACNDGLNVNLINVGQQIRLPAIVDNTSEGPGLG